MALNFKDKNEMHDIAQAYFNTCDNADEKSVNRHYSPADVAEALGFDTVQKFIEYGENPGYKKTVEWIMLKIKAYLEKSLLTKGNPIGAIAILKEYFNWKDYKGKGDASVGDGIKINLNLDMSGSKKKKRVARGKKAKTVGRGVKLLGLSDSSEIS